MKSIIVIGGGASGLMAAIVAAREGARVTILEAMEKPAKKLLMTGNGRCNLTNLDFSREDCYRGGDLDFCRQVLAQFDYHRTMQFFEEMGLLLQKRGNGVYPLTDQASSVADRLLLELAKLHVKLKCQEKVTAIEKKEETWTVFTEGWHYEADAVILACGSRAVPVSGSDGSGYALARMCGHTIQEPFPALVPLKCKEAFVKKLAGLRTKAVVTMEISSAEPSRQSAKTNTFSETGELQWTEYGISGIVVFQLSRYASAAIRQKAHVQVSVDCLPSVTEEQLLELLTKKKDEEPIGDILTGILPKKMIPVILELCQIRKASARPEEKDLSRICHTIKHLRLTVNGTRSFDQAQVCGGGVTLSEINPCTMESRISSGLYLTGELMDVDGICGGYNLQWAWTTGYLAGKSSAAKVTSHKKGEDHD